ncbi:ABC transporter ATP-binding protein [Halodesulfovibrio spirochaetisodalis]|uniref:ABC transporter ATP-binding protein n=1 Tax=Halodesulfovibrio spirochaetisodalis TaxID=1560234 RepID=UPI00082ADB9D|nr:ABC transporter ATP-binding protein [Halodesulfovibrio spirochaetisodalis]
MALVEMLVAGSISFLGVAMSAPEKIYEISIVKTLFSYVSLPDKFEDGLPTILAIVVFIVCLLTIIKNICQTFLLYIQGKVSIAIASDFGTSLLTKLFAKDFEWHLKQDSADLLAIMGYRVQVARYINALLAVLANIIVAIALVGCGLFISFEIMCIVVLLVGAFATFFYNLSKRKIYIHTKVLEENNRNVYQLLLTALNAVQEIYTYGKKDKFVEHLDQYLDVDRKHVPLPPTYQAAPAFALEAAGMLALFISVLAMIWLEYSAVHLIATLSLLAGLAWRLLPTFSKLVNSVGQVYFHTPYMEKFFELFELDTALEAVDTESVSFDNSLTLQSVTVKYGENFALDNVSFSIKKGEVVGIIGSSGAGKTTMMRLLTGVIAPTEGFVKIDGIDLVDNQQQGYCDLIGVVPQQPFLLNASFAENIAFSKWGEEIDREKVLKCCQMAAIDFISQLSDGLDTVLGERGVRLSGGQIQRVAIARALYNSPEILFFDEATSALDGAAEQHIQETVEKLSEGITVAIVAHRLTTVEKCDSIIWLEKGQLIMHGNAEEVLSEYKKSLKNKSAELASDDALRSVM